ncbi:hypothetical protein PMAYCL1PPCAC_20816, partial [Pristionchus mayeri]
MRAVVSTFLVFAFANIFLQPYACLTCGEQFELKGGLVNHLRANTGHTDQKMVRTIDAPNDIKEEPLEIKEESINHFNEEEPIADMFCSTTGISRPLDQSTSSVKKEIPSKTKMQRHICIVCNRLCSMSGMHIFTANSEKRAMWVDAVRQTPEGRKSLMELLNKRTTGSYLCASHFSPSDYNLSSKRIVLRFDAVPFFEEAPPRKEPKRAKTEIFIKNKSQATICSRYCADTKTTDSSPRKAS